LSRPRVLILGGGFAGLSCANALDPRRFDVSLVDARRAFEFLPNIHELVSGVKGPAALRISLHPAMRAAGHHFVHGRVTRIDPGAREAELEPGQTLKGDYLVLALGAVDADYGIPGVGRHTLGFKCVDQCKAIHNRLNALARKRDPAARVVIVGGGLEGVEALGEVLRRYRDRLARITLVEAQQRLLPGTVAGADRHLRRHCGELGVEVITGDAVARITAKTVFLRSGRRLRSDATIWTGGPAPAALLAESGLAPPHRWAPVRATLEHRQFRRVYVIGDAAELPEALRKQAYHAIDMGVCAAANIEREHRGRRPRAFRPAPKPTLVSFGDVDTLLLSQRLNLAGAALARSRSATRELLWPAIGDLKSVTRLANVRRLR
jgi:NADH dehydrogenase